MHSEVDHVKPEPQRVHLDRPKEQPREAEEEENVEPPPDDEEDFVVDDVQREHTYRVDVLLFSPRTEPVPVAGGNPRECVAHGVLHPLTLFLLFGKLVILEHLDPVKEKAPVEKAVRQEVGEDGHEQIENLAEDETVVVNVVLVMDVAPEELEERK